MQAWVNGSAIASPQNHWVVVGAVDQAAGSPRRRTERPSRLARRRRRAAGDLRSQDSCRCVARCRRGRDHGAPVPPRSRRFDDDVGGVQEVRCKARWLVETDMAPVRELSAVHPVRRMPTVRWAGCHRAGQTDSTLTTVVPAAPAADAHSGALPTSTTESATKARPKACSRRERRGATSVIRAVARRELSRGLRREGRSRRASVSSRRPRLVDRAHRIAATVGHGMSPIMSDSTSGNGLDGMSCPRHACVSARTIRRRFASPGRPAEPTCGSVVTARAARQRPASPSSARVDFDAMIRVADHRQHCRAQLLATARMPIGVTRSLCSESRSAVNRQSSTLAIGLPHRIDQRSAVSRFPTAVLQRVRGLDV